MRRVLVGGRKKVCGFVSKVPVRKRCAIKEREAVVRIVCWKKAPELRKVTAVVVP
jgi:hypothetical protein